MVVQDSASNITSAINILRLQHYGCYAHMLNLVVQGSINPHKTEFDLKFQSENVHFHCTVILRWGVVYRLNGLANSIYQAFDYLQFCNLIFYRGCKLEIQVRKCAFTEQFLIKKWFIKNTYRQKNRRAKNCSNLCSF